MIDGDVRHVCIMSSLGFQCVYGFSYARSEKGDVENMSEMCGGWKNYETE